MEQKRLLDLVLTVPVLLALTPLMVTIALAVRWSSPGPALFRQVRAGRDGRPFVIYKFRTMWNEATDAPIRRLTACDPGITPIGHWLRRFSLDELPQLLNVLEGTMSLVGPRPTVPEQAERYDEFQRRRLDTPPGLTGWAQINGRNTLPWEARIALDVWYVEHRSLGLDLTILARTVGVVIRGEGVYAGSDLPSRP